MSDWKKATELVHAGARRSQYGEMSEAIFLTQGFVYRQRRDRRGAVHRGRPGRVHLCPLRQPDGADVRGAHGRDRGHRGRLRHRLAAWRRCNGALFALLKAGDHVVSARALFGSCLYVLEILLPRFGVEVSFVDGTDLDQWRAAVRPDTRAVFLESMSNPTLEVIDMRAVAAHRPRAWRPGHRRQRLCHPDLPKRAWRSAPMS